MTEHITVGRCDSSSEPFGPVTCGQWLYPDGGTTNDPSKFFVRKQADGLHTDAFFKFRNMIKLRWKWIGKVKMKAWLNLKQLSKLQMVCTLAVLVPYTLQ